MTKPFQVFFVLAIIYYLVCWTLTHAAVVLERRIARKRAGLLGRPVVPAAFSAESLTAEP